MKTEETSKKPFQFQNQRQTKIYASLKRFIGNAPASFYKDACKVMDKGYDLETKTHLVGHLMREVCGWIMDVMLPVNYTNPKTKDNHRQKIRDVAKEYSIDQNHKMIEFWSQKIAGEGGLSSWAHKESMESVRPLDKIFEKLLDDTELLLDFLLDKIEANYLAYTKQIDELVAKKTITSDDIKKLKRHIPLNQTTLGYFFDKLEHSECLGALKENGFFKYPQKPLEHEDGGVSFPFWTPMTYLIKMSKIPEKQNEVLEICLGINTNNINVQVQILEIALNLPADKSVKIVNKSYSWFDQINTWFHPENFGKLIVYLAKSGLNKDALVLASKLLEVKPNPRKPTEVDGYTFPHDPVALFDDYQYEKILKDNFSNLVDIVGLDAIRILLNQIENYISLSDSKRKRGSKDDYSEVWRPAIEDNSQNHKFSVRDILVTGARDACAQFLTKHPDKILVITNELESRKLNIFSRLSLHLIRVFPTGAEKKIVRALMDKNEFTGSSRLSHEYFLLAETHSQLLDKKQRDEVWSWIMTGADVESHKKWVKQNGSHPTKEELQKYEKNWQMYHLLPFKHIDGAWEKYYQELVKAVGKPEFPSFRSWTRSGSFGQKGVISNEQLKTMKPEDIVDYLKKWKPDPNDPLDRSRESTGREITTQITDNPSIWIDNLSLFIDLDPTYVRSMFTGYRDAVKAGKKIDWEKIMDLSLVVLAKPIEITEREPSAPFGDDPSWSWCRHTIVELITEGLKDGGGQIPLELKEKVWEVIKELTDDADPTPEHEKEYLASHSDPLSLAINSTRGDAMDAAIQYGIWLKSSINKDEQEKWNLENDAPELLGVLNSHLDTTKDPSLGIRALYGEKLGVLTWLDENWVVKNQFLIFPSIPKLQIYFDAAWEAFITFVQAYDNVFKILKPQYERAVKEIGKHTDNKHHLDNPDQNLSHNLIIFYWRGLIELNNDLLVDFYKTASVELKAEVIDFVGRVSKNDNDVPQKVKDKFVALLELRISTVKKSKDKNGVKEFESISWWVASEKFDDKWVLGKLLEVLEMGCDLEGDHLVMERFVTLAQKFPVEIVKCSKLLVENDKKGWGVMHWRDDLKTVIKAVLNSGNGEAKIAATEFVHRLAARGHIEFKDLLPDKGK